MSTLKYNQWLNTDNTENYKCRAWVNFNGTGTVAIRASGNVSSITDNGTGNYSVNFTNSMSDTNYSTITGSQETAAQDGFFRRIVTIDTQNTGSVRVLSGDPSNAAIDIEGIHVAIFR